MALRSRGTYVSSSRRSGWITGVSSLAVQSERQCCMKTVCRRWIRAMSIASSSTTSGDGGRRYAGIGAGSRIRYMSRPSGAASRLAACPPLHAISRSFRWRRARVLPDSHAVKLGDYSSLRRGSRDRMGPALRIHAATRGHQVAPEGTRRHAKRYDLWSRMRQSTRRRSRRPSRRSSRIERREVDAMRLLPSGGRAPPERRRDQSPWHFLFAPPRHLPDAHCAFFMHTAPPGRSGGPWHFL